MNSAVMRLSTVLVGIVVAAAFAGICLIFGVPADLDTDQARVQFGAALGVNVLLIVSPFLYAALGRGEQANMPVNAARLSVLGILALLSVALTLCLYLGLGFKAFMVSHLVLLALMALAWLGLHGMDRLAVGTGERQNLSGNRRVQLLAALREFESSLSGMPGEEFRAAQPAIGRFLEEVRLLSPMQTDRNPQLLSHLWMVVQDLRESAEGHPGAKSWAEALSAAKAATEMLKQA